jgi:Holliday junction resolvasome RuvABC endonuclease subunit
MTYQVRFYNGMKYRQLQSYNTQKRQSLTEEKKQWLKSNDYRNIGWEKIIKLYEKITEFLLKDSLQDMSLEDIFLEADRIGNKYQNSEEIHKLNQQLSQINQEISDEIDKHFPDDEIVFFNFSSYK